MVPKLSYCPVLHTVSNQAWEGGLAQINLAGDGFTWLMYTQVSFLPPVPCSGWYSSGGRRPHGISDEAGEGSRWNLRWYWGSWPTDTRDQGLRMAVFHEHIWYCDYIAVFEAPYCWTSVRVHSTLWIFTHLRSAYEPCPSQTFSDTALWMRHCYWNTRQKIIFDFYTELSHIYTLYKWRYKRKEVLCYQPEISCLHFAGRKWEQILVYNHALTKDSHQWRSKIGKNFPSAKIASPFLPTLVHQNSKRA